MLTSEKTHKKKKLRHAEYYDMTAVTDNLFAESQAGKVFANLIRYIASEENIKLAYRNIKRNGGSITHGTDKQTIRDIEKMSTDKLVTIVQRKLAYYTPKPVRRKEIPKPDGRTRPLGIPCIIDRIIQQCILQILEPICEAKFYSRSNGFRPNRSAENAIAQCEQLINLSKLHFVVDVDIKGFFDNVNHCKLKQQLWTMGIQDKKLLSIISQILKAPIVLPNGTVEIPDKGTPQGGILSPLLANVVLNELDWWIVSQWENMPTNTQYNTQIRKNGAIDKGNTFRALRTTTLKEMHIVRYADDFKISCPTFNEAQRAFIAVKDWLNKRLKLQINEDKSKVVNLREKYSEFLGFKLKVIRKRGKWVMKAHMSDKAIANQTQKLIEQVKLIQKPKDDKDRYTRIQRFNSMVIGMHNYYQVATNINLDCQIIARRVNTVIANRLKGRISKTGNLKKGYIYDKYGKSRQLRFCENLPIVPIGYVQTKHPMQLKRSVCNYTEQGRAEIHKKLGVNMSILHQLMQATVENRSVEYMDNRISLYAAQYGKCAITGLELGIDEIHCHHKTPVSLGGTDRYQNLTIVHEKVHKLIHATSDDTIEKYLGLLKLDSKMLVKLNKLRQLAKLPVVKAS